MAMYLSELVFILELAVFCAGLVILYHALEKKSALLKSAAIIMIVGSVLTAACTTYYSLKYYKQGAFDTIAPMPMHNMAGMREHQCPMMKKMGNMQGMMKGMQGGMMPKQDMPSEDTGNSDHEAHH